MGHDLKTVADFGKCDIPECEDNARLMAASKEMLALLKVLQPLAYELVSKELSDGAVGMSNELAAVNRAAELLKELT